MSPLHDHIVSQVRFSSANAFDGAVSWLFQMHPPRCVVTDLLLWLRGVQRPRDWAPGSPESEVGLWWGGPLQVPSPPSEAQPLRSLAGGGDDGGDGDGTGFETPPQGDAASDSGGSERYYYEDADRGVDAVLPGCCFLLRAEAGCCRKRSQHFWRGLLLLGGACVFGEAPLVAVGSAGTGLDCPSFRRWKLLSVLGTQRPGGTTSEDAAHLGG